MKQEEFNQLVEAVQSRSVKDLDKKVLREIPTIALAALKEIPIPLGPDELLAFIQSFDPSFAVVREPTRARKLEPELEAESTPQARSLNPIEQVIENLKNEPKLSDILSSLEELHSKIDQLLGQ